MKQVFILLITLLPYFTFSQNDSILPGVKFQDSLSWNQIKSKAKVENKYIFVDCYASWCGPCKLMDRNIYPNFRAGYAMNEKFISVKLQMDSSIKDNERVKSWYPIANSFMHDYKVEGFPTFLFFSPEGKLVHKDAGYKDLKSFIRMSELARDPQKTIFYTKYQDFKNGKREYVIMGDLALFTKKLIGDQITANLMAQEYKNNYLNSLDTTLIYSKKCLNFIYEFSNIVNSEDEFFRLAYREPKKYDSVAGFAGEAKYIVNQTISYEEIETKVLKDGNGLGKNPNWELIQKKIAKKFRLIDAKKLVLEYKVKYYRDLFKDWSLWAKYKDELIKTYPPKPPYELSVFTDINGHQGAWHAFLHCNDTVVLIKALEWADLAISLQPDYKDAYLDTKANILYKLGRVSEAIQCEEEAVEIAFKKKAKKAARSMQKVIEQMKRGEPTYLKSGAVWDVSLLPKKQNSNIGN